MVSQQSAMSSFKKIKLSEKSSSPQKPLEFASEKVSKVSEQLIEYDDVDFDKGYGDEEGQHQSS